MPSMVKISALLFSFACACALVQSAAPMATQVDSVSPVESRRMLKGGGGSGRPSGNRPSGNRPSGNRPSTSTANGSPGGGVIVGSSVASGTYVGSRPYISSTYSTGHRGNNHTESDEIVFAGDGGSVPASPAVGSAPTFAGGATVVTVVVFVFTQGL